MIVILFVHEGEYIIIIFYEFKIIYFLLLGYIQQEAPVFFQNPKTSILCHIFFHVSASSMIVPDI